MLKHITIRTPSGHASSLQIDDDTNTLKVIGILPHQTEFAPDSVHDACQLISWLQAWIEAENDQ